MTVRTALLQGTQLLEEGAVAAPRLTAEVLLCHALHQPREWLYAHPEEELDHHPWLHYGRYLHERLQGKPTQYITGRQEFYGREFRVRPGVFIPRPETEHLVETAMRLAPGARDILEICCGSGAIAVTLALELRRPVSAADLSPDAAAITRENAARLGADVRVALSDLCSAFASGSMDLLAANPPYIPLHEEAGLPREVREFEPRVALFGGPEGLDAYRRLITDAARVLRRGGWLVCEIGYQQAEAVRGLLAGWSSVEVIQDLAGWPRVVAARRAPDLTPRLQDSLVE